jgi:hypothetical protein
LGGVNLGRFAGFGHIDGSIKIDCLFEEDFKVFNDHGLMVSPNFIDDSYDRFQKLVLNEFGFGFGWLNSTLTRRSIRSSKRQLLHA